MSVAVIADSHLGGPGGDAEGLIAQLEEAAAGSAERIVLLGDIFHVWVAHPRFETPEVAAVLPVLRRLRAEGMPIDYVEGNRDFFVAGGPYADAFTRVGTEVSFEAGGNRYLAVHGDGLDPRDLQYRFWRWLSKSAPSRFLVGRLPRRLAHRTVYSTEARLATTNLEHKRQVPEAVLRTYGERRLAEGHDVLLLGHFHEPHRFEVEGGEVRILDAWFRSRQVEWFG